VIQKINDKGIDGDEGVNMEENIEENIEKDIEKSIKEIVKQIIKEIVEEMNMEKGTGDPAKLRRNGRDRK
jgi:hypothetical protein